jgi:hypothetical protein
MKIMILTALLLAGLTGCVYVPPSRPRVVYTEPLLTNEGTVIYEGVEYYYDPTPAVVAGEVVVGLYFLDAWGHRRYHYVPRRNWHEPIRHHEARHYHH